MADLGYTFKTYDKETMARAIARNSPISTLSSIEMCNYLRQRYLSDAKLILERVSQLKQAIPFKRFCNGAGHKRGKLGPGKYPVFASLAFLSMLNTVEANAQQKGMNTSNLKIIHINAQQASRPYRASRNRGRRMKQTHLEVVVQEVAKEENKQVQQQKHQRKLSFARKQEAKV